MTEEEERFSAGEWPSLERIIMGTHSVPHSDLIGALECRTGGKWRTQHVWGKRSHSLDQKAALDCGGDVLFQPGALASNLASPLHPYAKAAHSFEWAVQSIKNGAYTISGSAMHVHR